MLSPINIDCTFLHCKSNTIGLPYPLIYVAKVCTFVATGTKNEINASFSVSAHRFSYSSGIVVVFYVTYVHWFTTPNIIYFLLLVIYFYHASHISVVIVYLYAAAIFVYVWVLYQFLKRLANVCNMLSEI